MATSKPSIIARFPKEINEHIIDIIGKRTYLPLVIEQLFGCSGDKEYMKEWVVEREGDVYKLTPYGWSRNQGSNERVPKVKEPIWIEDIDDVITCISVKNFKNYKDEDGENDEEDDEEWMTKRRFRIGKNSFKISFFTFNYIKTKKVEQEFKRKLRGSLKMVGKIFIRK